VRPYIAPFEVLAARFTELAQNIYAGAFPANANLLAMREAHATQLFAPTGCARS